MLCPASKEMEPVCVCVCMVRSMEENTITKEMFMKRACVF